MLIERVLVHPIYIDNSETRKFLKVWQRWEELPSTYTIPVDRSIDLSYTGYLACVAESLVIGGQAGRVCVATHLKNLAKEPSVKKGRIQLVVSREATLIDDSSLDYVLRLIFDEHRVVVGVTS